MKINYIEQPPLKNCWVIKFSLDEGIYLIPFSHSNVARINKTDTTEEEFLKLLEDIYGIIGKYNDVGAFNPDTLPDLEDLDSEKLIIDRFEFDYDDYQEQLIPFDSIEVLEYREDGSCYLLEILQDEKLEEQ